MLHETDLVAHVTYTSIMTLATAAGRIDEHGARSTSSGSHAFIDDAAAPRHPHHRSASPTPRATARRPPGKQDDPDAYVHVVDRQPDGVVIRGAKLHITGASLGHELMTIPTKAMKAGEEDYAIAAHGAR